MFDKELLEILVCPNDHAALSMAEEALVARLNRAITAGEIWNMLLDRARGFDVRLSSFIGPLDLSQSQGTLATRIAKAVGRNCSREDLQLVYQRLADCLDHGVPFQP